MGTHFDLLFTVPCLGFIALLAAWLVLAFTTDLRGRAGFGIIGSLIAAILLGVLWHADHFPWLWQAGGAKAVPIIWLGAAVLNGFALASGRGRSRRVLGTVVTLGVAGFFLHATGAIAFLWAATMSV